MMKKEAKLLLERAKNSLVLSIDHFNRPWDCGRAESVLILLDHSFEMMLKAAILHRGGKIREKKAPQTIGFDACVRRGLTDGAIKFLTDEDALLLQTINSFRDAAQHHLLDISEAHLYMQTQAGVTLFKDVLKKVFNADLAVELPERVLPVSTRPPTDLLTLFENEVAEVRRLLKPGKRRGVEVRAKLRSLAIIEKSVQGERLQPSEGDLNEIGEKLKENLNWEDVFPGVATINISADGAAHAFEFRITKKEGMPVYLVKEGTPGAAVVAVKKVNELGFYSLGPTQVAEKVGLTRPKCLALIAHLDLKSDDEYFKIIKIGKMSHQRYSPKAVDRILEVLPEVNMDQIWIEHRPRPRKKR
ncbi:MAG: hypothetical protein R6V85_19525 [Polyangia bacterium]